VETPIWVSPLTLARRQANGSGDIIILTQVYHVLLHLKRRLNLGDFFKLIEDGGPKLAPAASLLQVYAREQNRDLLKDFYFQDDRRTQSACLSLEEAASMSVSRFISYKLASSLMPVTPCD